MAKGIDQKFVLYGIHSDYFSMIEAIYDAENIDFEWLSEEIMKAYHAKRVGAIEINYATTEDIIRPAITGLQKGALIIKDQMTFALGMGNKYKKINVTHLF